MADRWAVATGNWSDTATWNGGTLPASGDDVYSNNFIVTIDQSITVNTLRHAAGTGITAGGYFSITGAGPYTIIITSPILGTHYASSATTGLFSIAGSATITITCPSILPGALGSTNRAIVINSGFSGNLTVTATITGNAAHCIQHNGISGTLTVNGTVTGAGTTGYGILSSNSGPTVINGDCYGGGVAGAYAYVGNASGGLTHNGSSFPGNGSSADSIVFTGSSVNVLTGTYSGLGATTSRVAVRCSGTSQTTIYGLIVASTTGPAVIGSASAYIRVDAILEWAVNGVPPIDGNGATVQFKRTGSMLAVRVPSDDTYPISVPQSMITYARYGTGNPAPQYVRSGTTYGPSGASTGTYVVPAANAVSYGVAVGNTTGTAYVKGADVAAVVGAQVEAALSGY